MYKKLTVDCSIPKELEKSIEDYLAYLNTGETTAEDCYQMEVLSDINWCIRERLVDEDILSTMKRYYVLGGIHKEGNNEYNN